jgi:hypothetical protein
MVDDLFSDDDLPAETNGKNVAKPKKSYMDKDWMMSPEDTAKMVDKKKAEAIQNLTLVELDLTKKYPKLPKFALMYQLKEEFGVDFCNETHTEHLHEAYNFLRFSTSHLIFTDDDTDGFKTGVCMIWQGRDEEDHVLTMESIRQWIKKDPYMLKEMVKTYEILPLPKSYEDLVFEEDLAEGLEPQQTQKDKVGPENGKGGDKKQGNVNV